MSENTQDWAWWQIAAVVAGGLATAAVLGYVASGGKSSKDIRAEHHKRAQKGQNQFVKGNEIGASPAHGHGPSMRQPKESSPLQSMLTKAAALRETQPRMAIEVYKEALDYILRETKDPSHLFVGVVEQSLAKCYNRLDRHSLAKKKFLKAIDIFKHNNVAADTIVEFQCELALTLASLREFDEADRLLQNALRIAQDPTNPNTLLEGHASGLLAQLRKKQGRFGDSERHTREAIRLFNAEVGISDPATIDYRTRLIEILLLRKRPDLALNEAKQLFNEFQQKDKEKALVFIRTSVATQFLELGYPNQAETILSQTVEIDSNENKQYRKWLFYYIASIRGEHERAQVLLEDLKSNSLDSFYIPGAISEFFGTRTESGLLAVFADEDKSTPMLQFRIFLRILDHVYPFGPDPSASSTSTTTTTTTTSTITALDDIDDDDDATSSSSSSSTPYEPRYLPESFYLVASFDGPEDCLVPDASFVVDNIFEAANLKLESDPFDAIPPGLYSITVTAYKDESRAEKLCEHKQYFPWRVAPGSPELQLLAHTTNQRKAEEEEDIRAIHDD